MTVIVFRDGVIASDSKIISRSWTAVAGFKKVGSRVHNGEVYLFGATGETAYAAKNNLPMATLQSAEGTWVKATTENIMAAAANAKWKGEEGFYQILASQPGKTTYPIVAATFILLPQEKAAENKEVSKFFTFAFEKGAAEAEKLGYIPLPKPTVEAIEAYLKTNGAK